MPLVPTGLGVDLLDRIKKRIKTELGFEPAPEGPPSGVEDIRMRIRKAVNQDPPKLVHALYQAKDANAPTWRHLAPYSQRDRGSDGAPLLYAACEKEGFKIEAFDYRRFLDFRTTNKPWPPAAYHPYRIEFKDR